MYCTIDDLLSRIDRRVLINLSNDVSPATEINMDCINENITIADYIINSSLRNKYSLPLPSIPKILVQISADIVIYRLYARRPQDVPKNYLQNFEDAKSMLKDLQNGSKVLEFATSDATAETKLSPKMYITDKTDEDRIFSNDLLRGFRL